jgi:hypothetical protein
VVHGVDQHQLVLLEILQQTQEAVLIQIPDVLVGSVFLLALNFKVKGNNLSLKRNRLFVNLEAEPQGSRS